MPFPSEPFTSNKWLSLFAALDVKVSHPDPAEVCEGCHEVQRLLLTRVNIIVLLEEKQLLEHIIVTLEQTIQHISKYKNKNNNYTDSNKTDDVNDNYRRAANVTLRDNISSYEEACFDLLDALTLIIEQCLSLYLSSSNTKDVYYRLLVREQIISISGKLYILWFKIRENEDNISMNTEERLSDGINNISNNNKENNITKHTCSNHKTYVDGKICCLLVNLLLSSPFCDALIMEELRNKMQSNESEHNIVWQPCNAYEKELCQEVEEIQECIATHPSLLVREHILQLYQNSLECKSIVQELHEYCNKFLCNCNIHLDSQAEDDQERVEQTSLEQHDIRKLYNYSSEEYNDYKCKGLIVKYAVMRLRNICVEVLKLEEEESSNDVSKGEDDNSDVNTTETKTCNNNDGDDDEDNDRSEDNDRNNFEEQKFENLVNEVFSAIATCNSHDEMLRIINLLWYLSAADEKAVAHCFRIRHLHQMKRFISTLPRTNADVRVFVELFKWLIAFTRHNTLCNATKINATHVQDVLIYTCLQSMLKLLCKEFHLESNAANQLNGNVDETREAHYNSEKEKEEVKEEKKITGNIATERNNGAIELATSTINVLQHNDKKSAWDDQQKSGLLSFILSFLQFNSRCNVTGKPYTESGNKANRQYSILKLFDGKVLASLVQILQFAAQTREVQIFLPTTVSGSDYSNNHHNGNNLSDEVYLQLTLKSIANSVMINATFACKTIQILMNMYTDEMKEELLEEEGQEVSRKAYSNLENLSYAVLIGKQNVNNSNKEQRSTQLLTSDGTSWRLTLMPFLQLVIPLLMEIALRYPTLSVNYEQDYVEFVNATPIASTFSRGMSSANLLYEQASHTYAFSHCTMCQSALDALLSCLEIDTHCNLHSITWEALIPLLQSLFDFTQTSIIPSVKSMPYTICSLLCNKKVNLVLSLYKEWPQLLDHALNEIINACIQTEHATNSTCPEHLMKTQMASTSAAAKFVCTIAESIYEHRQNNSFLSTSNCEEMTTLEYLAKKLISVKAKVLTSISLYDNILFTKNTWNATMSLNQKLPNISNVAHSKPMSSINSMTLALVQLCAVLTRLEYSNNINSDDETNNINTETNCNDGIHTKELIKEQLPWLPQWQILVSFTTRNNWLLAQASHAVLSNAISSESSCNPVTRNMCTNKSTIMCGAHHYSKLCSDSSLENNNNIARALHSLNKILLQYQYTITIAETLHYLLDIVQTLQSADNAKENELQNEYKSEITYYNDHNKCINGKASENAYGIMINRYFTPTLISEFAANIFALPSPQEVIHIILSRFNVSQEMLPDCVECALREVYNNMIIMVCAIQQTYPVELSVKRVKLPENMFIDLCARLQDTSVNLRAQSQIAHFVNRIILCVKGALIALLETNDNKTERKNRKEGCCQETELNDDTFNNDDDNDDRRNILEHNINMLNKYSLALFTASTSICTFPSLSSSPCRCEELNFAELEYNGMCALLCSLLRYFAASNAFAAKSSWLSQCVEELYTLMQEWSKNEHSSAIMKTSMQCHYNNKINKNSVHNKLVQNNDVRTDKKNITPSSEQMEWECKRQQVAMYLSIVSNYFANVECNVLECNSMHQMADIFCTGLQCIGPIQMITLDAIKIVMQSKTGQMCLLMETGSTLQPTPIKKLCKLRTCFDLLLATLMRGEVADEHVYLRDSFMQSHNTKSSTSQISSVLYSNNKKYTKNSNNSSKYNNKSTIDAAVISCCFDICTFLCGKSANKAFVSAFIKHKCLRIAQRQLEQQCTNREMSYNSFNNNKNKNTIEMWWRLLAAVSLHTEGQAELMRTATLLTIIIETASRVDLTGTLALLILRNLTFHDSYKAVLCQDARVLLTLKAVLLCISINELLCRLYSNTELIAEVYDGNINNSSNSVADNKQASSNSAITAKATTRINDYTINFANKDWSNVCKDNMTSNKYNNNGAQKMSTLQYNLCMFCKRLNLESSPLIEWAEQVTKKDAEQRKSDESVVGVYTERRQELAASALLSLTYYHDRDKFYVKQVMEQEPRVDLDKLISAQTNHTKEIRKEAQIV